MAKSFEQYKQEAIYNICLQWRSSAGDEKYGGTVFPQKMKSKKKKKEKNNNNKKIKKKIALAHTCTYIFHAPAAPFP